MKRNILLSAALIVLAVLAGCTPQSNYPATPVNVAITQNEGFIKGSDFDASKFTVVVSYLDGSSKTIENPALAYAEGTGTGAVAGVSVDDTVSFDAGYDLNNNKVTQKVNISRVYGIDYITATTTATNFTVDKTSGTGSAASELFTVTAYATGLDPVVLGAGNYSVTLQADTNAEDFDAATEVTAVATVSLIGNLATANNNVEKVEVEVTATKEANPAPSTEITNVQFYVDSCTFALPAFDYNGVLPEANEAADKITVSVDSAASKGSVKAVSAVDGVELYWADARGEALDLRFVDNTNFASGAENKVEETGIYIAATWNGKKLSGVYQVPVAKTSIELAYGGASYVKGTPFANVKLNASDFKAELYLDEVYAETLAITDDMLTLPTTGSFGSDTATVTLKYQGLTATDTIDVAADGDVTYTISSVDLVATPAAIYQQVYDTAPVASVNDLAKVIITGSNGTTEEITKDFTTEGFTVAYSTSNSSIVALKDGQDLSDVAAIYLAVTYTYDTTEKVTFYKEIKLGTPEVTAVNLSAKYTYVNGDTPIIGTPIEWTLMANVNGGSITLDESDVTVYVNGEKSSLPAELTSDYLGAVVGYNYEGKDTATTVTLAAQPSGYVDVSDLNFTIAEGKDLIGKKFSAATGDYTPEGASYIKGYTDEEEPEDLIEVVSVSIPSSLANIIDGNNTVTITYKYVGEEGEVTDTYPLVFPGTAWDEGDAKLSLGETAIGTTASGTGITADSYVWADFTLTGLKAYGDSTVAYKAEMHNPSEDYSSEIPEDNSGFTLAANEIIKVTLTWTGDSGKETTKSFYVKGVEAAPEA